MVIALILLIIGYLGTVLIAWQSISKRNLITYIALIFVLLGAAGAIWVTIDTSRTTDQLVIKSEKISDLSGQLASSQHELTKKADNQAESQRILRKRSDEIASLNRKNAELNEQIAGSVTGGDSFCYLFPSTSFVKLNTINFNLFQQGKYPVYDVSIMVWDDSCLNQYTNKMFEKDRGNVNKELTLDEWQKMNNDPKTALQNMESNKETFEAMHNCLVLKDRMGTITPKLTTNIFDSSLISYTIPQNIDVSKFSQEYSVSLAARNGQYNQKIKLEIRNKRYYVYSKVEKVISDSKRIVVREYESIDSEGFVFKNLK